MYAIVEFGGKQYKISEGSVIDVDKTAKTDKEVKPDKVLLLVDKDEIKVGTPSVDNVQITAEIADDNVKGDKIIVFKWKRRKNHMKRQGHRHKYTKLKIKKIEVLN
ncbi:MAG: 50S ribosomal protein L21 [Candidatus Goldiibacteriota bacterium]